MPEAGLSLGSNLGDKAAMIEAALMRLRGDDIRILGRSRLYRTSPWGNPDQDWFLNACVLVETGLSAHGLLERCLGTENELGRSRAGSSRWGPRSIDIDILFYDDANISEPGLEIPHPHLFERAFVLVPLAEIAGDRIIGGKRVSDAVRTIDTGSVTLWDGR